MAETPDNENAASTKSPPPYTVIVGLDFSELGDRAVLIAAELGSHHPNASVHALVAGELHDEMLKLPHSEERLTEQRAREHARQHVADLVEKYQRERGNLSLERIAVYAVGGDPATQLLALSKALDADLIVVGTHGRRGVQRLLLGSVAEEVMRNAECNVYVVRPRDFVKGEKVPDVAPPLREGEPHLKHFEHRRTYHYVDRVSSWTGRQMPVA